MNTINSTLETLRWKPTESDLQLEEFTQSYVSFDAVKIAALMCLICLSALACISSNWLILTVTGTGALILGYELYLKLRMFFVYRHKADKLQKHPSLSSALCTYRDRLEAYQGVIESLENYLEHTNTLKSGELAESFITTSSDSLYLLKLSLEEERYKLVSNITQVFNEPHKEARSEFTCK